MEFNSLGHAINLVILFLLLKNFLSRLLTCQEPCFRFYLQVSLSIHTEKNNTTWSQIGLFLLLQICSLKLSMRAKSVFCVRVGKWPNNISGLLKFNKTSLFHTEKFNVRCTFMHQVHCQLCRGAPRLRRLWLQQNCHQHYFGQTLAKAVPPSQTHAEQDVGKHARSVRKTNGDGILVEWRR